MGFYPKSITKSILNSSLDSIAATVRLFLILSFNQII